METVNLTHVDPTLQQKRGPGGGTRSKNWDDDSSLLLIKANDKAENTKTCTFRYLFILMSSF
jgi:hypothetical protein